MLHLIVAILVNAVPIYGVVALGWSVPTVLALFWCENFLGALANAQRIRLHARTARRRGHVAYVEPSRETAARPKRKGRGQARAEPPGSYLRAFLRVTLLFTVVHGVFVAMIVKVMHDGAADESIWLLDLDDLRLGIAAVFVFLAIDLLVDLPGLADRPFLWIETASGARIARVFVLHVGLVAGMLALMAFDQPIALLLALMAAKTAIDALVAWGNRHRLRSDEPPAWLRTIAPTGRDDEPLADYWARAARAEIERQARNEEIVPP